MGKHFKIKTGHQSLKFLLQQRITTPAQQKWLVKLMGFDFEVLYKKGTENTAADALLRKPKLTTISTIKYKIWERIQKSWHEDQELSQIIQ